MDSQRGKRRERGRERERERERQTDRQTDRDWCVSLEKRAIVRWHRKTETGKERKKRAKDTDRSTCQHLPVTSPQRVKTVSTWVTYHIEDLMDVQGLNQLSPDSSQ